MTVKTIFKVLIGSIVIPSCGFVLVESYNLMAVSNQIQNMEKVAAQEACEMVVQESYSRLVPPDSLTFENGTTYYNSRDNFMACMYKSVAPSQYGVLDGNKPPVYVQNWMEKYLMEPCNTTGFGSVVTRFHGDTDVSTNLSDLYYSGQLLCSAYGHTLANDWTTTLEAAKITNWNSPNIDTLIQKNIDVSRAYNYSNLYYTPANIGIPYIHSGAASSIFQYNLGALFSEYNPERMRDFYYSDTYSNTAAGSKKAGTLSAADSYVSYKGWQIYTNKSLLWVTNYDTYNLLSDRGRKQFEEVTGMNGATILANIKPEYKADGSTIMDPYYITVSHVNYVVPVRYEGVTPLKRVIAWLVNEKRVVGLGDDGNFDSGGSAPTVSDKVDVDYTDEYYENLNTVATKNASGEYNYPTSGELYFTLVR